MVRKGNINNVDKRELIFKSDDQEYAVVIRALGNCRFEVKCIYDESLKIALVRGSMRKRKYVKTDDIVLVSRRDFDKNKVDIIHLYTIEEVRYLKAFKELPNNVEVNQEDEKEIDFECTDQLDDIIDSI